MNSVTTTRQQKAAQRAKPSLLARLVARPFHKGLDRIDAGLAQGSLEATLPDGRFRVLGGRAPGPLVRVDLKKWRALIRLGQQGSAGWYEAWAAGEWDSPDPVALFDLFMRNRTGLGDVARASGLSRLTRWFAHHLRRNHRAGAKRNIMAHYDLGNDFYVQWLDETMSYSSALYAPPINGEEALEDAQARKVDALLARMNLSAPAKLLEIGCGWGHAARTCAAAGHDVTAITLSPAQKSWAEARAQDLPSPPQFKLCDYRDITGQFDAIISVEMVEAVGQAYWPAYLDAIARALKPGGHAAIQFIAIAEDVFEAYAASADFIQTHIFPGGMLLSESRFRAQAEARGLRWEAPEHFPLHYAETLRRWRVRFDDAVEEGRLPPQFDARFVRLWRYYLQYCEGGFRGGGITVAQVTLVKGEK